MEKEQRKQLLMTSMTIATLKLSVLRQKVSQSGYVNSLNHAQGMQV
jgi:hypothetical protein